MPGSAMLEAAIEAARAAEQVIRHHYARNLEVELKADRSPVTIADVESEKAIRGILEQRFPDHGFYGEETGQHDLGAEFLWLVDPIDGTKSFVRRSPYFSTQIALMHRGELVLGVSNAPAFREMAWAERGAGARLQGEPIRVSGIDTLDAATLSMGNIKSLARSSEWPKLGQLVSAVNRTRGYGDCFHYHQLASGRLDAVLESDVNILDVAACAVIVREAGGEVTTLEGGPLTLDATSILATNGCLHPRVMSCLSGGLQTS